MTEHWWSEPATKRRLTFMQARIAALLGERDRVVEILGRQPHRGDLFRIMLISSDFDSMRDHPLVAALLQPSK